MQYDVIIIGGGLAGLGLAKQLIHSQPDLSILVLEKKTFPRPSAIAKVGESTVEIGSHYLAHRLGLKQHLKERHLEKFGIRMFFGCGEGDFALRDELGASRTFGLPTYQIDRGVIENELYHQVRSAGVTVQENATICGLEALGATKAVTFSCPAGRRICSSRWLIDAAGRAALFKNQLNLAQDNAHKANAVWFRVDKRITIDTWSNSQDWRQRCDPADCRWLSTNHLTGPGYWLWIIPLASDITSIGVVMDNQAFADGKITDEASARAWLSQHQPFCAEDIRNARFFDFVVLRDYSYNCKQLFSSDRWAITGEAGVFPDPFYSPGSDFIAIGNDIITELICADFAGEDIRIKAKVFDQLYKSIYDSTLSLYTDQYGGFGDKTFMGIKLLWDYSYYWGVLSLLYFRGAFTQLSTLKELSRPLRRAQSLNQDMQTVFRERAAQRLQRPAGGSFMNQREVPCLQHFNQLLSSEPTESIKAELSENIDILIEVAAAAKDMLKANPVAAISEQERTLLGDYRAQVLA